MHFYTDYIKWQIFYGYLPFDILHIIVVLKRFFVASEDELLPEITGIKYNTIYNINELVQQVKNTVKIFRKDNPGLGDSVYSFIFGNIKFWTLPAAEKICALFHKYDEEMLILNQPAIIIDDDAIKVFVKYRNDITHGSHRVLDVKIAITAHCLEGLVYCCLLERIGVERSRILEWCKDKILR